MLDWHNTSKRLCILRNSKKTIKDLIPLPICTSLFFVFLDPVIINYFLKFRTSSIDLDGMDKTM